MALVDDNARESHRRGRRRRRAIDEKRAAVLNERPLSLILKVDAAGKRSRGSMIITTEEMKAMT